MSELIGQVTGVIALLAFVVGSAYVLDRVKKAERRDTSGRLENQEDGNDD